MMNRDVVKTCVWPASSVWLFKAILRLGRGYAICDDLVSLLSMIALRVGKKAIKMDQVRVLLPLALKLCEKLRLVSV